MASRFTGPVKQTKSRFTGPEKAPTEEEIAAYEEYMKRFDGSYEGYADPLTGEQNSVKAGKEDRGGVTDSVDVDPLHKGSGLYSPNVEGFTYGGSGELIAGLTAPLNALKNKFVGGPQGVSENFQQTLAAQDAARDRYQEKHPYKDMAGQVGGMAVPVLASGALTAPEAVTAAATRLIPKAAIPAAKIIGTAIRGAGVGGAGFAASDFLATDGPIEKRMAAVNAPLWPGHLGDMPGWKLGIVGGAAFPPAAALLGKTLSTVGKIAPIARRFSPDAQALRDLARQGGKDMTAHERLVERAAQRGEAPPERDYLTPEEARDAETMGHDVIAADLLGKRGRALVKAGTVSSPDAAADVVDVVGNRTLGQKGRANTLLSRMFGDELNPAEVVDNLKKEARAANEANYKKVYDHPDAANVWTGKMQQLTGSKQMQDAIKHVVQTSMDEAAEKGQEVLRPSFRKRSDNLMDFDGMLDKNGKVVDAGSNLQFWDKVKQNLDGQYKKAKAAAGHQDTDETMRLLSIKNQLIDELDTTVPDYKVARGTAKEFFDGQDAFEWGSNYGKKMNGMNTARARQEMEKLNPHERELFARGFASELANKLQQSGDSRGIRSLFDNEQARMKMRDALGPGRANAMELATHIETTQSLLGRAVQGGSNTLANLAARELLAGSAGSLFEGGGNPLNFGGARGFVEGIMVRHGLKYLGAIRMKKYGDALARIALSNDPAVKKKLIDMMSKDKDFMKFSRAFNQETERAARKASFRAKDFTSEERVDPRMPFKDGGIVDAEAIDSAIATLRERSGQPQRFANGGAVVKVAKAAMRGLQEGIELTSKARPTGKAGKELVDYVKNSGRLDDFFDSSYDRPVDRSYVRKKFYGPTVSDPTHNLTSVEKGATKFDDPPFFPSMYDRSAGSDPRYLGAAPDRSDKTFLRYTPKAGMSKRMQSATRAMLDPGNPVRQQMMRDIEIGRKFKGEDWYNTEELRDWFVKELGPERGDSEWRGFMQNMGSSSAGSRVPLNIRNASAMRFMEHTNPKMPGTDTQYNEAMAIANKQKDFLNIGRSRSALIGQTGFGHRYNGLHQQVQSDINSGGWLGMPEPDVSPASGNWTRNPKPKGFTSSFLGNPSNIAADLHFTRYMGMSSAHPDWLVDSAEVSSEFRNRMIKKNPAVAEYFREKKVKGKTLPVFDAKKAQKSGHFSMDDAQKTPAVWAGMPGKNEYGAMEKLMAKIGDELGLTAHQVQASLWMGAAKRTGVANDSLGSFMELLRNQADRRARETGSTRAEVIKNFIVNKGLLSGAGVVAGGGALANLQEDGAPT